MRASLTLLDGVRILLAALVACALLAAAPLRAAQPYVTDDARLVPAGACQLEVGKRVLRGSREAWLLPACNPLGNLELSLGMNRAHAVDTERATAIVVQAKSLIRELKPGEYGLGWVANLESRRHPRPGQSRTGDAHVAGIYSHSFRDDTFFIHANAGVRRLRDEHATEATWGLAAEYNFTERIAALVEASDTTRSPRGYQAGLWFALVPDRLELDISVGGDARDFRETRYWTVGIRMYTAPFLK